MTCKSCSNATVAGEEVIACEGFCASAYHTKCVGLSTNEKKSCIVNPHMFWICADCSSLLRKVRYSNEMQSKFRKQTQSPSDCSEDRSTPPDVRNDIADMKKQIEAINKTLAEFTTSRLCESNQSVVDQPIAHSSPASPYKLAHGCRKIDDHRNVAHNSASNVNERFWLFFTRIKNDVTEDEMHAMVAESLGVDDGFLIKKLVPYWKDVSLLPFISFKVGIDPIFRDRAMCSSTWPTGINFREFREQCNTWQPLVR